MGFELPNGKTARNIQEQVKFLTEKLKDLYSRVNELEIHIEVVDELPETGVEGTIYLLPASDPEEGNYYEEYIWLDDAWELIGTTQVDLSQYYTKTEADQKFVDFETEQTIPSIKKFENGIEFDLPGTSGNSKWRIKENQYGEFTFERKYNGIWSDVIHFNAGSIYSYGSPSLGTATRHYVEGFINKITDTNGSYSSENVFNVINAADIVSNTLTQAQYDLITNGKPTLLLNYNSTNGRNGFITPLYLSGNYYRGVITQNYYISSVRVHKDTRVISYDERILALASIGEINNKAIPAYPSSPATPQYLTYGTNNQLSWTGGASGTILYKHEITFSGGKSIILVNNVSTSYAASSVDQTLADLINDSIMSRLNISGNHSKIVSAIIDGTSFFFTYGGIQNHQAIFSRESVNTSETISTDTVTQL